MESLKPIKVPIRADSVLNPDFFYGDYTGIYFITLNDKQTINFAYPNLFVNESTLQVIRLELGALASWTPAKKARVEPYAAKYYPNVFDVAFTSVLTSAPERIFWEKATISLGLKCYVR